MKIRAEMGKKLGSLWPLEYMVDKVVEIQIGRASCRERV